LSGRGEKNCSWEFVCVKLIIYYQYFLCIFTVGTNPAGAPQSQTNADKSDQSKQGIGKSKADQQKEAGTCKQHRSSMP
jgi:hypothetical protein